MLSFLPKSFISYPLLCNKLGYQVPESSEENSLVFCSYREKVTFFPLFFLLNFYVQSDYSSNFSERWMGNKNQLHMPYPHYRASAQRYTSLPQHLVHLRKRRHSRVKALLLSTHSGPKSPLPPPLCRYMKRKREANLGIRAGIPPGAPWFC